MRNDQTQPQSPPIGLQCSLARLLARVGNDCLQGDDNARAKGEQGPKHGKDATRRWVGSGGEEMLTKRREDTSRRIEAPKKKREISGERGMYKSGYPRKNLHHFSVTASFAL